MRIRRNFIVTGVLFLLFFILTGMVLYVDRAPIGPNQSMVGLSTWNKLMQERIGQHPFLNKLTGIFMGISLLTAAFFCIIGLLQCFKRKGILRVDKDILLLGVHYILIMVSYALFEIVIINYRPILVKQELEASYPSSHVMLVVSIMAAALLQIQRRIKIRKYQIVLYSICSFIMVAVVIGRLLTGMHWATDILAGLLLGSAFAMLYISCAALMKKEKLLLFHNTK